MVLRGFQASANSPIAVYYDRCSVSRRAASLHCWMPRGSRMVPTDADFTALDRQIHAFGCERVVQERNRDALLAHALTLHPAGFAVLDPGLVLAASPEIAERALGAVAATIGGRTYPPRGRRVARLRERLAGGGRRGHTLGGCRFVVWRGRVPVFGGACARP